jgi:hypothetical protein
MAYGYGSVTGGTGATGITGATGSNIGITGVTGPTGNTGATGPTSTVTGATGNSGATGNVGATGNSGATGSGGAVGNTGATGPTSTVTGATGNSGGTGNTGLTGNNGATGLTGSNGAAGPTGLTGANGNTGATGSTGTPGTYTMTTLRLLGRTTAGSGAPEEIVPSSGITLTAGSPNMTLGAITPTSLSTSSGVFSTRAYASTLSALTPGSTVAIDASLSNNFSLSPTASSTFNLNAPTNAVTGQVINILVTNPATAATITYTTTAGGWKFPSGASTALSGIAGQVDIISAIYDGSYWRANLSVTTVTGLAGATGATGSNGATGTNGTNGATGVAGNTGNTGATGSSITVTDDNTTNATYYPLIDTAAGGSSSFKTTSSYFKYNPNNTAGGLTVSNTTASTTTATGALIVAGGVGIAGAAYHGGTIFAQAASGVVYLTGGYMGNANGAVYFGDASALITSASANVAGIRGSAGVQLGYGSTMIATFTNTTATIVGSTAITDSTASTGTTSGCLKLSGGLGVVGAGNFGGIVKLSDATAVTAALTGCLQTAGGIYAAKSIVAAGSTTYSPATGGTVTIDCSIGNLFTIILPNSGTAVTIGAPSNPVFGQSINIILVQGSSANTTVTWTSTYWKFVGGAKTISTGAGSITLVSAVCQSSATPMFYASMGTGLA